MSVSSFMGLQTALRGLLAQQRAIDTTGHNIANANTEGYSRQSAVLVSAAALDVQNGQLGTGVDVATYQRVRDRFLDLQYRTQSTRLGGEQTRSNALDNTQLALAEPGDNGIAAQLQKFWSAWSDVANAPESQAARQALVDQGRIVTDAIHTLSSQLQAVSDQSAQEYTSIVGPGGQVQEIATQIAGLNDAIRSAVASGQQPNDLLDRRDLLLDKLAPLGQVSVADGGDGTIDVTFGGTALVTGTAAAAWPLTFAGDPGGKLGALAELSQVPGGTIDSYLQDLNGVAKQLADGVNALHTSGGGPAFFSYTAGNEAASLTVAVTAASVQTTTTGAAGGNELATQIAALRGGTADSSYTTLVSRIGQDASNAQRQAANAEVLTNAVQDRRQSVAGVSLDEEMTNLTRFQTAYQASARAMTVMDSMLDVLVNRTGRVGL